MMLVQARGEGWLGVAKPPGIAVIPGRNEAPELSLKARVEQEIGARVWVVHRLDRDTSGALLFATTAEMHRMLCMAFEERRVQKRYLALTQGVPQPERGNVTLALHSARKGKMRLAADGEDGALASRTEYEVVERFAEAALVRCVPHTGRQHQIRVHMRALQAPLLADSLYGKKHMAIQRLALHAERVSVGEVSVAVPLWPDMQAAIAELRRPRERA